MTHTPKNPHCHTCQAAKAQTTPAKRRHKPEGELPTRFGEYITADHIVLRESDQGVDGEQYAVVILDRGTGWIECHPVPDKTSASAQVALARFAGPRVKVETFYSDNSEELRAAASALGWSHTTSVPGQPQTNGVAERAVRTVLEGTRATLEHADKQPIWWPYAARFWCFARNVAVRDGDSAWCA